MAAIDNFVPASYVKDLVEKEKKTHKEVSEILRQVYPGVDGLSERSVRRYCATYGIRRHDTTLTSTDLDIVVSAAVAEVSVFYFLLLKPCSTPYFRVNTDLYFHCWVRYRSCRFSIGAERRVAKNTRHNE